MQSPWTPQFLVSVILPLAGILWSAAQQSAKIDAVNVNVSDVKERLKRLEESATAYDKTSITLTKDQADILRRISQLEGDMGTQQKGYNYDISRRLAVVEAKAGIDPPKGER